MDTNSLFFTTCLIVIASSSVVRGQDRSKSDTPALTEINAGVCAFKAENYTEAEKHFRQALAVAPSEKRTYKLLALSLEMQYHKNDSTPANQAIGREAIAAYAKFLDAFPAERTAVMESAQLYKQIEAQRLEEVALTGDVAPDVRAEIYVLMSAEASNCVGKLVEANRQIVKQSGKEIYKFKTPTNQADLQQAEACAARSIQLADRALNLSTDQRSALSEMGSAFGAMSAVATWRGDIAKSLDLRNKAKESYDKYSEEQKRIDAHENDPAKPANEDDVSKAQMADAAKFVLTGKMVLQPSWDQLTEAVHPSYDEIFGAEPTPPKTSPVRAAVWGSFTSGADRFSAAFPGGVIQDRGTGARTYTSGRYLITVMRRPLGPPAEVDETSALAMAAWGSAHSICNFVRMGGAECDVRLLGPRTIAGHPALVYRLDQIGCPAFPGVLVTISTKDRIFVILTRAGDENNADVKRFLASIKIN